MNKAKTKDKSEPKSKSKKRKKEAANNTVGAVVATGSGDVVSNKRKIDLQCID